MTGGKRVLMVAAMVPWAIGCASSAIEAQGDADLSAYFIQPVLCEDQEGPDCSALPLGDTRLTTTGPARDALYACSPGNPSAPGSDERLITWIDFASGTWDLLRKPWLPAGGFDAGQGTYAATEVGDTRTIQANNLPVDRLIGDWPMTDYPLLSAIDRNPGVPQLHSYTFTLPVNPVAASSPNCVSLGPIGITQNGVVLYNAVDGRGDDAVAHEIVDAYGGHPAMTDYHYHFVPERLDDAPRADGHSGLIGYIRDGYAIYGYHGVGGTELTNTDLDECHGHQHDTLGYHYHATMEYPYTIGCYHGTPR